MVFPRLHRGRAGRITFAHMNDVFSVCEDIKAILPELRTLSRKHKSRFFDEFSALILENQEYQPGRREYAWVEAIWDRDDRAYVPKDGGRSSSLGGSMFSKPAFNRLEREGVLLAPVPENTPVILRADYGTGGTTGNVVYTFSESSAVITLAHPARIAAVSGSLPNFVYDAQALDDPSIVLNSVAPINRYVGDVDYFPATINAFCWIVDRPDLTGPGDPMVRLLIIESERPVYEDCGSG